MRRTLIALLDGAARGIALARSLLTNEPAPGDEERQAAAMTEGRGPRADGTQRCARKVGAWVEHGEGGIVFNVYDDRGWNAASVFATGTHEAPEWSWFAARPFLPVAFGNDEPSKAEAQAHALEVLESWCDVSQARKQASGYTASNPLPGDRERE